MYGLYRAFSTTDSKHCRTSSCLCVTVSCRLRLCYSKHHRSWWNPEAAQTFMRACLLHCVWALSANPLCLSLLLQGSFVVTGLLACWTKLRPWTSTGACNRAYCPRKTCYHAHAGLGAVKRGCGVCWPQRYTVDLHRCPPHLNDGGLCVKLPTRLKLLLLVL